MPFSCEKCFRVFSGQQHLDNHINRKTPCISQENDNDNDNSCEFCHNKFVNTSSLKRHYSRCAVRNNHTLLIQHCEKPNKLLLEKDKIIEQMKAEIAELKSKIPNPVNKDNNLEKIDKTEKKSDDNSKCEELNVEKRNDFVYVIKEREFIKTKENIYKIGRTKHGPRQRVSQYPKNSIVFNIIKVPDSKKYEDEIKKIFKKKFIQRKDIGTEYFEANIANIRKEIYKIVKRLDKSYK